MRRIGKRLLALLIALSTLVSLLPVSALAAGQETEKVEEPAASQIFTDVPSDAWFHDAVEYVYRHDIFQGTSDTHFSPDGTMTRGMMVTVLGRIAQIDPEEHADATAFTDVEADSWYAPYVAWAADAGITDGVGGGRFAPDEPVTRAQMAVFLWRYFQYIDAPLPETVTDGLPGDYDSIPAYAREAVEALWRCGIFQGGGDGTFIPDRQLTRAEVAMLCMRVDTHLVDAGVKTYPDDTENTGSGGSRPGGGGSSNPGGSAEELLYEPDATDNQTTATMQDAPTDFTITIKSTNTAMTADEVKAAITAADLSILDEDGKAVTDCIQVSGENGTYTLSGQHADYNSVDESGNPKQVSGFAPGHTYKITLNDDQLTFKDQGKSVREYDFTVARPEDMNLKLSDDMVYIPAGEIGDIIVDGQPADSLDVALFSVDEEGIQQDAGADSGGSFTYGGGETLAVGSIVAVYEGTRPDLRGTEDTAEDSGVVSYVRITKVDENNRYEFEGAEVEEVLFTPDMFPLPDTYLDTDGDNTITVPANAFVFSGDIYTDMGLDSSAQVDAGDYIAFYSGYLDPAASDPDEQFGAEQSQYAKITGVTQSEPGGDYTISYEEVELQELLDSMNTYVENDVDVGAMMTEQDISALEVSLEQEAQESGFAREAAEEIARLALRTNSLEQVRSELGLSSLTVNGVGSGPIAGDGASLLAASGSGSQISIELGIPRASVSTTLEHFSGMDGLRVELNIPFTLVIQQSGGWELRLEFDPTFIQELRIGVSASVDVIWDNFWYIVWWPDEFVVTANVDVYTFTDIDIDVNVVTDDGQADTPEQIEELTNFVDEIKSLLDGGGADPETAESLAERYQEMLQNDSEWVDLFSQRILHVKQNVAKIITIYIDFDFVVSGNVNVYIGMDFTYELGRRYIFTIRVFDGTATSDTISLVPEQYTLDVYVMGKLGLRAGLRVTIGVALIHKAVASVEVVAEIGPYIELYGFFYYQLHHLEGEQTTSQAAGAMYVEVGLYAEMSANLSAIGGLLSWSPEIFSVQLPLWSAGNRYPVIRVSDQTYADIAFEFANPAGLPSARPTLVTMDLKTGEEQTRSYDWDQFEITTTNDAVYYDETYHVLWARQPYTELDVIEEGQVVITWTGDNGCLAFNAHPIQYTIDFRWDKLLPGGYQIFLITGTDNPSWIEYLADYGEPVDYGDPTGHDGTIAEGEFSLEEILQDRVGYTFSHWEDAEGNEYTTEELPATMPASDSRATYFYAQWEKTPVQYTVKHFYEATEGMEIAEGTETRQLGDQTYYLKEETYDTALMGEYITGTDYTPATGYAAKPYFQGTGWLSTANDVLENYYDRQYYNVTFTLTDGAGNELGNYSYDLKYMDEVKIPEITVPAGYTFSGWGEVAGTMPDHDLTYSATLTPNEDTPYTVEHYVQQPDTGSYELAKAITYTGTTDTAVKDVKLLSGYDDGYTAAYDTGTVIKGDGSTVIKVRYTLNELHTVTFIDDVENGRTVGRSYLQAGAAITPPEVNRPGYTPMWRTKDGDPIPATMPDPAQDLTFYATWVASTEALYTVEHYVEKADGSGYDLVETQRDLTGAVGQPAVFTPLAEYSDAAQFTTRYDPVNVAPEGTTVLQVYYDRVTYDITYHLNRADASFTDPAVTGDTYTVENIRFGATVSDLLGADAVSCEGVVLAGWYTDAACTPGSEFTAQSTMPARDLELYAQWTDGYVITVNHYQELADHDEDAAGGAKYDLEHYDTETITVAKGGETSYTPAVKTYEHFTSPAAEPVIFQEGINAYTADYYYDRAVYPVVITYETGTYDSAADTVTTDTDTFEGEARYGQTLTTVFDGKNGYASLNFGHVLTGEFTDSSGGGHTTMPAPATEGGTVTLTAEWEGDTFEVYFTYGGRADVLTALQDAGIDAEWDDMREDQLWIYLTYGEEALLPEITGLRGLGSRYSGDIYCAVGEDLASPKMYKRFGDSGNVDLVWEETGTGTKDDPIMIYDIQGLQSMASGDGSTYYQLGADLDLSRWSHSAVSGTIHLDGDNHSISNLAIRASYGGYEVTGLFKSLNNSTVKNLTLQDVSVTGSMAQAVGILAGEVTGDVTLENVSVVNSSIDISDSYKDGESYYVGGLVGRVADGASLTLVGCRVESTVKLPESATGTYTVCVGGFVGYGAISDSGTGNTNSTGLPDTGGETPSTATAGGEVQSAVQAGMMLCPLRLRQQGDSRG